MVDGLPGQTNQQTSVSFLILTEFKKLCDSGFKLGQVSQYLIEKLDHSWHQDMLNIGLLQLDIVARTLSEETEKKGEGN